MVEGKQLLSSLYKALEGHFCIRDWWGIGAANAWSYSACAVLTQGTAWENAQKAYKILEKQGVFASPHLLCTIPVEELQEYIRSAGFVSRKVRTLQSLFMLFSRYEFSHRVLKNLATNHLRSELLSLYGIGMETADTILLYAFEHPIFVVDSYTKRLCERTGLRSKPSLHYEDIQDFFMGNIPCNVHVYQKYHMYIVEVCKQYCLKKNPRCCACPLTIFCKKQWSKNA